MRRASRLIFAIPLLFAYFSAVAKSKPQAKLLPKPKVMTTLGEVDGEFDGKTTTVTLRLDKKPSWETVPHIESHGTFLQLILPETIVPEPGKFFDGGSELIPKVAVFQLTPSDAGIRFFVSKDADKVQSIAKADLLDRRVVLSVDQHKLDDLIASVQQGGTSTPTQRAEPSTESKDDENEIPDYIDGLAKVESAESVIARVQVDRNLAPPSEILKGPVPPVPPMAPEANPVVMSSDNTANTVTTPPITAQPQTLASAPKTDQLSRTTSSGLGINLREKLIQITLFFGALAGLLLLSLSFRTAIRRRARNITGDTAIDMKMLANLPLAARQKLSLIQVGDERILVGVTPENITFIANLSRPQLPPNFGKILSQTEIEAPPAREQRPLPPPPAPRPKLKNLPGNDEVTLSEPPIHTPPPSPPPTPRVSTNKDGSETARKKPTPQRINVAVGDDGPRPVTPVKKAKPADNNKPATRESVDDVTKMIREKLRQLKSI